MRIGHKKRDFNQLTLGRLAGLCLSIYRLFIPFRLKRSAVLVSLVLMIIGFLSPISNDIYCQSTISIRVNQGSDDAEQDISSGNMILYDNELDIGEHVDEAGGMRFRNVPIPHGSIITNAYIRFHADASDFGSGTMTFYGHDTDNAPTFSSNSNNLWGRTKTSASVSWPLTNWSINNNYQTSDLSIIIQEIIDRPGWTSGNAIVIVASATDEREAEAYDGAEPHNAPLIVIEYYDCSLLDITDITAANPSNCPSLTNGSIVITGNQSPLEYSIDNGSSFQASNTFNNLLDGTYDLVIRNTSSGCTSSDQVTLTDPSCQEVCGSGNDEDDDGLIDCQDPDCQVNTVGTLVFNTDEMTSFSGTLPGADQSSSNSTTFAIITNTAEGSVTIDDVSTGAFTYTAPGECPYEIDTFYTLVYEVYNPHSCADTATITINVTDVQNCPEICGNGIDDDNDGFLDCYDSECGADDNLIEGPIIVNSSGRDLDQNPGDGYCITANCDCTLAAAIQEANARPGKDTIQIQIPSSDPQNNGSLTWISLVDPLPDITDSVLIDGTTQSGFIPSTATDYARIKVELRGQNLRDSENIMNIRGAGGVHVRGLAFNRNDWNLSSAGIVIWSDNNWIEGCHIGTNVNGTRGYANNEGIRIFGGDNNLIGGPDVTNRNIISGNEYKNISIINNGVNLAENNQIENNWIGIRSNGTSELVNDSVYTQNVGVYLQNTSQTSITDNIISFNHSHGIHLIGTGGNLVQNTTIQSNKIGVDRNGVIDHPNDDSGIFIENGVSNVIGGVLGGEGNIIKTNGENGITIKGNSSTNNRILANAISDNVGIGIDLQDDSGTAGVSPNDPLDADAGANELLNTIELYALSRSGITFNYDINLDAPTSNYRVEFFSSTSPDATGHGEGENFIGFSRIFHPGGGDNSFTGTIVSPLPLDGSEYISATITRCTDVNCTNLESTSEFSEAGVFCDNFTSAGTIDDDEQSCTGFDPAPIIEIAAPSNGGSYGDTIYQWEYLSAGLWVSIAGANEKDYDPPFLASSRTYRRAIRKQFCSTWLYSNEITKTVYPLAVADAGTDVEICEMSTDTLEGSGGVFFEWSPSEGLSASDVARPEVSATVSRTYTLTITDANGCTAVDSVAITVNPLPSVTASSDVAICVGGGTAISASASGGGGGFNYQWSHSLGSGNTKNVNPLVTTTYRVTVEDIQGCIDVDSVTITVNNLPEVTAGVDTSLCLMDSIDISAIGSNGSGGYTYSWSNGLGSGSTKRVSPITNTSYRVTVEDSNGCTDTDEINIVVHDLPWVTGSDDEICRGDSVDIIVTGGIGGSASDNLTYSWSNGLGGGNYVLNGSSVRVGPLSTTTYSVTVTSDQGCIGMTDITITVNDLPIPDAGPNVSICLGESTSIVASAIGGSGTGYDFNWSNGVNNSNTITVNPSITTDYYVTVVDSKGCENIDSVKVIVHSLTDGGTITSDQSSCTDFNPDEIVPTKGPTIETQLDLNGLIAHYDFDNSINDISGNGYHGSIPNGISYQEGHEDYAIDVDGSGNNYVVVSDNPNFRPNAITISSWIKPSSSTPNDYETVIHKSTDGNWEDGFGMAHYTGTSNINFYVNHWSNHVIGANISADEFTHVVGTYDGSEMKLYINGQVMDSLIVGLPISHSIQPLYIGSDNLQDHTWNGAVDDTRLYNRALDPAEVAMLYDIYDVEYLWQTRIPSGSWTNISSETKPYYDSGIITESRDFRRRVRVNGCSYRDDEVTMTIYPSTIADAGVDTTICPGISVQLMATGGTSYVWDNSATLNDENIASPLASPTSSTLYTVTVTDANNCTGTDEILVSLNQLQISRNIERVSCLGAVDGGIDLMVSGADGMPSYDWDNDGTGDFDDDQDLSSLASGVYNVTVNDDYCSQELTVNVGVINQDKYSALIITDADNTPFPSSSTAEGYVVDFPIGAEVFDISFDHQYIMPGLELDSSWLGTASLSYTQQDVNASADISHIAHSDVEEYFDSIPGVRMNSSGKVYDVYGDGNFEFGPGSSANHQWTLNYQFTDLDLGYLPANTLISFEDVDGLANGFESIQLSTILNGGGTSPWLGLVDKTIDPGDTPQNELAYNPSNNTYNINGSATDNGVTVYRTLESIDRITVSALNGMSPNSEFKIKLLAPLNSVNFESNFTQPNCTGFNGVIDILPFKDSIQYSIDGGATFSDTSYFSGLSGGTYDIQILNVVTGCIEDISTVVLVDPPCIEICDNNIDDDEDGLIDCEDGDCYRNLNVDIVPDVSQICGNSSVNLSAIGSGGDNSYTFTWDNGLGTGSDHTVSPTVSTTYRVTVEDDNGCMALDSLLIPVFTNPTASVTNNSLVSCIGVGVQLEASGGTEYAWSQGSFLDDASINNPIADPNMNTTFVVTVTDVNGCTASTSAFITAVTNAGNASAGDDVEICAGDTSQLFGQGGIQFDWSPSDGLSDSTAQNPLAFPMVTTLYTVTATDADGCIDTDQVLVTVNSKPVASITQDTFIICLGDSVRLMGSGGQDYSWSPNIALSDAEVSDPWAKPLVTRRYTLQVMNAAGCMDTTSAVVVVASTNISTNAGPDEIICYGDSVQLSGSGGASYLWTPSAGMNDINISNPLVSPEVTTLYTLVATDINGCTGQDFVEVTVEGVPDIGITDDQAICHGESLTLSATGGISYDWSPSESLNEDNISNPIATPDTTTLYHVTVTNNGGCFQIDSVLITVHPTPIITIPQDSFAICKGVGVATLSASSTGDFSWGPDENLSALNVPNPIATPDETTLYTVTVTSTEGCESSESIIVQVNSNEGNAQAGADVTLCDGESVQLNGQGGESYLWGPTLGLSDHTVNDPVALPPSTTTYIMTATDDNGCTDTDDIRVTVSTRPNADAGADIDLCFGTEIQLGASGGSIYSWSPGFGLNSTGVPDPLANPSVSTLYTLTVTNSAGCTNTDQLNISVFPSPVITMPVDTFILCTGDTVQLEANDGSIYDWGPTTGLSDPTIPNPFAYPSVSTDYQVTVTNVWGCIDSASVYVDINSVGDLDGDEICITEDNCPDAYNPDQLDTDGDGVGDACDLDDDNDGIRDSDEIATARNAGDTDEDGVPDHLDLDSDNDGILDIVEANIPIAFDINSNGTIDFTRTFGGNGLADDLETFPESGVSSIVIPNSDNQGPPDFQDLDSDDDGFCDVSESGANVDIVDTNSDGVLDGIDIDRDGINDVMDNDDLAFGSPVHLIPASLDNTAYPDYIDADRDDQLDYLGDGSNDDVDEAGYSAFDLDNDGRIDFDSDLDGDGIVDAIDADNTSFGGLCVSAISTNPPIAITDIYFAESNQSITIYPLENDFDLDGFIDTTTMLVITAPPVSEGNILLNEVNGAIYFTPAPGFTGNTSFQYTVKDNFGDVSNIATVTIVVGDPGNILTGVDVVYTRTNLVADISVLSNDFSTVGTIDTSSLSIFSTPANGSVAIQPNGQIRYIPTSTFTGVDNFFYTVSDSKGNLSNPTSVEVFIFDSLNLVVAVDDVYRLHDTITFNPGDNDVAYPDVIDPMSVNITQPPLFGDATINPDGSITYVTSLLFDGTDYMKYNIKDASGRVSNFTNIVLIVNRDTDGDNVPDIIDVDDDNDGILDADEIFFAQLGGDSDEDGIPDHLDLDSDNDGTNDVIEAEHTDANGDGFADGTVDESGLVSSVTGTEAIVDTDNDDIPDHIDLDSDNDGVLDYAESGNVLYYDLDGDGRIEGMDSDSDGILDVADELPSIWGEIADYEPRDSDTDNIMDIKDVDDDNDTILTILEDTDEDLNWFNDDTDKDGTVDYLDPDPFVFLKLKIFLQGCYDEANGLMRDDLRAQGYLPFTEPYTAMGYSFSTGGGETVDPVVFDATGPDAIVDWVIVELRDSLDYGHKEYSRAALLQRDGDVVELDGVSPIILYNNIHRKYYVGVKHRNHLGAMTRVAPYLNNRLTTIDFTLDDGSAWISTTSAFVTDYPMKVFPNNTRALWAGNVNFDDKMVFQGGGVDHTTMLFDILEDPNNTENLTNFIQKGYIRGDVNMDGIAIFQGSPNDTDIIFFNSILHPENQNLNANFIIKQQMPEIVTQD